MVPQQFLEMKAEQYNPDTLSCYDVDLQTLSPRHLSTSEKLSQKKGEKKSPDNDLEACNPQELLPFP